MKRNYELNEMYSQIKVQRSNLRIGESNYNKYLENLAAWQKQMVEVINNHNSTIMGLAKVEEYRFRVVQLEKEILKEKTRSRALADELEVPMNVHRWRILESSDPKRYEKVLQVQQLQKQLIEFSDKVTQLELLIQVRIYISKYTTDMNALMVINGRRNFNIFIKFCFVVKFINIIMLCMDCRISS